MTYETYTDLKGLKPGQRVRLVCDEDYQTVGSYAYDTEEETKAEEDQEIAKLESYEWVVFGVILESPCEGECGTFIEDESVWGYVTENTDEGMRNAALEMIPSTTNAQ
jgi:hypothetical protein